MSENMHATYFGQTAAPEATAAENETEGVKLSLLDRLEDPSTLLDQDLKSDNNSVPPISAEPEEDPFRASLISRMDMLVRDFREEKISRMETLYQILANLT